MFSLNICVYFPVINYRHFLSDIYFHGIHCYNQTVTTTTKNESIEHPYIKREHQATRVN